MTGTFSFAGDRQKSADILKKINQRYNPSEPTLKNIERLKEKESLAIVTGQQLGIYGGPVYTVFKTLTTIYQARKWEVVLERPVIPIFWLADEDHDYQEIKDITVLGRDELYSFSLPEKDGTLPPVAELTLPKELLEIREELQEVFYDTDFSEDLWDLLDDCFHEDKRFDYAFGDYLSRLFSCHGLVLAGSNHPIVKKHSRSCLKRAIEEADEMRKALQEQTDKIGEHYHQQVTLYDSNLFYLNEDRGRTKIVRNGNGWKTDSGKEWSTEGLIEQIDENPQSFSPNVFLRPVLQDQFLPTLGYVAGPGEIAYYGQMKSFYECFDMSMPVIFPRLSGTFIEPAIDRIFGELPFDFHEYGMRIEDLESEFVDRTEQVDIETIFKKWKGESEEIAQPYIETIKEIDPTLEGAAGKATAAFHSELDKLKGKVYRSVKQQEQTQLDRIQKIKTHLFPHGTPQERVIASVYYMNKYGVDLWDRLLQALEDNDSEIFNKHALIYL